MNAHKVNVYTQQPPRPSHSHSHESQVFSHFCGRRQLHPSTTHDWLITPNVMFLRFIHSVLLFHCYIIFRCMNLSKTCTDWFIHLTVGEHFPVSSFELFGIFLWILFGAHVCIFLCGGFLEMELLSLKEYFILVDTAKQFSWVYQFRCSSTVYESSRCPVFLLLFIFSCCFCLPFWLLCVSVSCGFSLHFPND